MGDRQREEGGGSMGVAKGLKKGWGTTNLNFTEALIQLSSEVC